MPNTVRYCGLLSSCLPKKEDPSPRTGEDRRGGNDLGGTHFIGLPTLRNREASKAEPRPGADVLVREVSPRNDSGRIGRGHAPLMFRRPPVETEFKLVYDTPPLQPPTKMAFFRHTGQVAHLQPAYDTRGMATLKLSGSERISSIEQVREIQRIMGDAPLVVVDLRQESHASVSDFPVTWRGPMDWANMGMDVQSVMQREGDQITALRAQDSVTLTHADHLKGKTDDPAPYHLTGLVVRSEQETVEAAGATYCRIAVTDHVRPERPHVDQFIQLARDLPTGAALHVHCNGGRGRTTTFMVLYDMLRNAREVGADEILARQAFISYEYNLTDASMVRPEKVAFLEDRLAFLHEFHAYARENPGGYPQTWSEWRETDAPSSRPHRASSGPSNARSRASSMSPPAIAPGRPCSAGDTLRAHSQPRMRQGTEIDLAPLFARTAQAQVASQHVAESTRHFPPPAPPTLNRTPPPAAPPRPPAGGRTLR